MNTRTSLLQAALWIVAGLLIFTGCDSTEANNETPFQPGPGIHVVNTDFVARAAFSYDVAVAQHARLRLDGINGSLEISGDPTATSVTVSGERYVGSDGMQDAERRLDGLEVRVEDRTDEVFIKTIQPQDTEGRLYAVDYTITLPAHLDVWVDHVNGPVNLKDLGGNVTVDLINGAIDCLSTRPPEGSIDLFVVNGNITLGIPTFTSARFSASVVNGRINTSNLTPKDLMASPQSMTFRLGDGTGTIALSTVNGNITITGLQ